ncbi:7-cyano-7-deazaguanine synthase [Methanopyrus sp. KOL6]|uniref:7-cyano-7-deazaguanine synthase n=1 Tax=Methanopyrus sp. KOL6 TaxID=1937004 RepID=UPI000B4A7B8B|nr:7-cyano-7-deazaguanine synthase [Methanopyrus sp. KOL6]
MATTVVLCSGGLDSSVIAKWAAEELGGRVICLFVDYGQRNAPFERKAAERIAKAVGAEFETVGTFWLRRLCPDNPMFAGGLPREAGTEDLSANWLPARNWNLLGIAAALCDHLYLKGEDDEFHIVWGINAEEAERFPDNTKEFADAVAEALKRGLPSRPRLHSPLAELYKPGIVRLGSELGAPMDLSVSCYNPIWEDDTPVHCGECEACYHRKRAFERAGIEDPTEYSGVTSPPSRPSP